MRYRVDSTAMEHKPMLVPKHRNPVGLLLQRIPEMKDELDESDLDLPYVVFGFFALYLRKKVNDQGFIERSFDLLNELSESGDPELTNLVQVAVFETIADEEKWKALAKQHLRDKAMALFRRAED